MCLEVLSREAPPKEGYFWKVFKFYSDEKKIFSQHQESELHQESEFLKRVVWLKSRAQKISTGIYPAQQYITGFHGFRTRKGARDWVDGTNGLWYLVIIKCKYKGAMVQGIQANHDVIVAREMLIPARKKRK